MKTHHIHAAIAAAAIALPAAARGDHHEPEMLENAIQQFYANMSAGNFAEAMDLVAVPSKGYLPYGMAIEIPNEMIRAMAAAQSAEEFEHGQRAQLSPKHIDVQMLGSGHALATYYVEGAVQDGHVEEHMITRASLVFAKQGDAWKIVHWHVSKLETAEEREIAEAHGHDDDHGDHDDHDDDEEHEGDDD